MRHTGYYISQAIISRLYLHDIYSRHFSFSLLSLIKATTPGYTLCTPHSWATTPAAPAAAPLVLVPVGSLAQLEKEHGVLG